MHQQQQQHGFDSHHSVFKYGERPAAHTTNTSGEVPQCAGPGTGTENSTDTLLV